MDKMSKERKYAGGLPFRKILKIVPMQVLFFAIYTIIKSLIPACQTLAVAGFVEAVERFFMGESSDGRSILVPLVVMLAGVLFNNLMPSIVNLVKLSIFNRLRFVLKRSFLRKQTLLKYEYIEDEESRSLIYRVCEHPEQDFGEGLLNLFEGLGLFINIISLLAIIAQASLISGIAIIVISTPLFYLAGKTGKKNYVLGKEAADIKRKYKYYVEILMNRDCSKERKLFQFSDFLIQKYEELFQQADKKEAQIDRKRYANMKSGSLMTVVIAMAIMLTLLPALMNGRMSAGLYLGVVSTVLGLVQTMSWTLSGVVQKLVKLKEYLKDVDCFWAMEEAPDADAEPREVPGFRLDTVEFRNVSFRYPGGEKYVLQDCSFVLRGGRCYAFVGKNGAGKTTITKLLMGLYDNYEGSIWINGKNAKEYTYAEIKWMCSAVFQDFARYSLTVRENILLGSIHGEDALALERTVLESGMDEVLAELPEKIDTPVGKMEEGGVDLSGGQWQRLAIARALYRKSPITILDEPTASLDPKAEARVYEMFQRVNRNRFTIFITHRLGAARISDEILVLDGGRIAERGTHDQLMVSDGGVYKEMFDSQRCWYEE